MKRITWPCLVALTVTLSLNTMPGAVWCAERIAVLSDEETNPLEHVYTVLRLAEEGYDLAVVSSDGPERFRSESNFLWFMSDMSPKELDQNADGFVGLTVPGGGGARHLKSIASIKSFIEKMSGANAHMSAICHGQWAYYETRAFENRAVTIHCFSVEEMRHALPNACVFNESTVRDNNIVTSQRTQFLPEYMLTVIESLKEPAGSRVISLPLCDRGNAVLITGKDIDAWQHIFFQFRFTEWGFRAYMIDKPSGKCADPVDHYTPAGMNSDWANDAEACCNHPGHARDMTRRTDFHELKAIDPNLLVLCGGPGCEGWLRETQLREHLEHMLSDSRKRVVAFGRAVGLLAEWHLLEKRSVCGRMNDKSAIEASGGTYIKGVATVDGNLFTCRGRTEGSGADSDIAVLSRLITASVESEPLHHSNQESCEPLVPGTLK